MIPRTSTKTDSFFLKQYLANINQQKRINQNMLKAVLYERLTGEQPPPEYPSDLPQQNTTDKYAELEKYKQEITQYLVRNKLMDGTKANDTISKLTNSQILYLRNNMNDLGDDLKRKYEKGIEPSVFLTLLKKRVSAREKEENDDDDFITPNDTPEKPISQSSTKTKIPNVERYIDPTNITASKKKKLTIAFLQEYINFLNDEIDGLENPDDVLQKTTKEPYLNYLEKNNKMIKEFFEEKRLGEVKSLLIGFNSPTPKKKTPTAVIGKGFTPPSPKNGFGKYYIHSKKLDQNVLHISRLNGNLVIPSKHISPHLTSIVKNLMEDLEPKEEHLEKLTNDDKKYLHSVMEMSDFPHKYLIPTPDKTDEEKELNEFQVLQGEILNGNTSIELVRKFKCLILKMSNEGKLPKTTVRELLIDLTTLGY
jgi:hypothetical protein